MAPRAGAVLDLTDVLPQSERAAAATRIGVGAEQMDAVIAWAGERFGAQGVNPTDSLRPRTMELAKELVREGSGFYRRAMEEGMNLSAYLEQEDPESGYGDGLDAFERMLKLMNIRVHSVPEKGIYSDTVEKFTEMGRGVPSGEQFTGERLYMSNQPASIVLFPEYIARQLRVTSQILPSILDKLVAVRDGITGDTYRGFYLDLDTAELSMRRIAEGADIPTAKLTGSEHVTRLNKYGRKLQTTYEVVRRMTLDVFAFHLRTIAQQNDVDKGNTALDVLINGDGNSNTAATNYNKSTLQSGGAGADLTLRGWLAFNLKFKDPYRITTIIGTDANTLDLLMLNVGTANLPYAIFRNMQAGLGGGFGVGEPINGGGAAQIFSRSDAPANALVAVDATKGLLMINEIGADIVETDKIISRQLNEIVMTEVIGFSVLDQLATKTLTLNA